MDRIIPRKLGIALAGVLALGGPSAGAEFEITSVHLADGGATVVLEFTSLTGMVHRAEMSPSLGSGTWAEAGVGVEGDGNVKRFEISTAGQGGSHFFRVTAATTVPTGFALNRVWEFPFNGFSYLGFRPARGQ